MRIPNGPARCLLPTMALIQTIWRTKWTSGNRDKASFLKSLLADTSMSPDGISFIVERSV